MRQITIKRYKVPHE